LTISFSEREAHISGDVREYRCSQSAASDAQLDDGFYMVQREPAEIAGIVFEAFPVDHSTRAPAAGYRIAAFTHCGSEIVKADEQDIQAKVQNLAKEREVEAQIAHDGMEVVLH
jgi:hypothetical protein